MNHPLYGMDVGFYHTFGVYPLRTRCEMLAELGYTGTNLTLWSEPAWQDLPKLAEAAPSCGLEVASVYATVDLAMPPEHGENARILTMIEELAASRVVELALRSGSGEDGDGLARCFLERALTAAERNDITLLLYPHTHFWLERVGDAVRLCESYASPRLGLVFPAFHWYAVDGADLAGAVRAAAPYLRRVNTNGSRRISGQYFPATIEPVGEGEFDNFGFLGMLRAAGYDGWLGVQGYGLGGDVYENLRRSRRVIRDIESRLDRHPSWAHLRPDHL